MAEFDVFHQYAREFERILRLRTYPLAVKMLEREEDIPEGAQRPTRDFGYHLVACQGFAMSRREGTLLAMMKEDMWCPEAVIGLGLAKPPEWFLDGHHRVTTLAGATAEALEAGSAWAREFPCLEFGKYIGIASAPLMTVNFEPDVVIIYCDPGQLSTLLSAAASKEGPELTCTVGAKGACVFSVVPPMQSGKYQVTVPCRGDRRWAMAQDNEMIFSAPREKLEDLMLGLRKTEVGLKIPLPLIMKPEPTLPESYYTTARMCGMEVHE